MPANSAENLIARLRKGQAVPAVLLLGSDAYLRRVWRDRIIEASVEPAMRDWAVSRFSAEDDDLERILAQARTLPMLAPRQVVLASELEAIEQSAEEKRDSAIEELTTYLGDPAPFTVLLLEAAVLDGRMRLAKVLTEKAFVIPAELPDDPFERLRAAAALAETMAQDYGSSIEPAAAEQLADLCNCSLAAIRTEIDKLSTYAGPGQPIRRADVEALVISEKKYSVWELAEVLASRRRERAFAFLENLLREGEQPPALVGAMAWMFRALLQIKDFGPHASAGQVAGRVRMRRDTAEMAVRQAARIPRQQLVDGLRALYEADSRLKSRGANPRAILEFLVARLTAAPAPSKAR